MTDDSRIADWLESGVVALSGFVPPGSAATAARQWSAELARLTSDLRLAPVRVDGARLLGERAALNGGRPAGRVSAGGSCRLLRCADGWIAVSLARPEDAELVPALTQTAGSGRDDPWCVITGWAAPRSARDVVDRARLLGLPVGHVGEGGHLLDVPATPAAPRRPVEGAPLVVDFSSLWAGPLCASLLGLAGARVVKVESVRRLDGARRGEAGFYDLLHAGHQSICIDPTWPADRAAVRALVDRADVVIEASRPRALESWGLSAVAAAEAGTVWVSITGYGRAAGDRVGFGDDVAAAAGLVGWTPDGPFFAGDAIADPLTGLLAAVEAVRAIATGGGALLDIAMADVVAATLDGGPTVPADDLPPGALASPPSARQPRGSARPAGADTASVLAELA